MLDFQINNSNFLILFGSYVLFFGIVFVISNAFSLLKDKEL